MGDLFLFPMEVKTSDFIEEIPPGIRLINAPSIWSQTDKGLGNVVAIIDSGCDVNHPDLLDSIIGTYNFTKDNNDDIHNVTDYIGHGTHVAGIIGARENSKGTVGVAPLSKLLILKVIDRNGRGSYENLKKALSYAGNWRGLNDEKVSVINISLGGNETDIELHQMLINLNLSGIITVTASGNYGDDNPKTDEILFPGYYKEVLQIGAIDLKKKIMPFSNSNNNIDFVAPGSEILSTYPSGSYRKLTGTSMAAPHIAGLISLILNQINRNNTELINAEVYSYLVKNSEKLGYPFSSEGFGLVRIQNP